MSVVNERIAANVSLVDYYIFYPPLCEKEGQVGEIDGMDFEIDCSFLFQ